MSDVFVGEILLVPYNFAPTGFAFCEGQLLPISQNTALFSLLGTNYGGNGTSTFGLPDLRGAVPIGAGQGPGLSLYDLGQTSGATSVTLTPAQMPLHTHTLNGTSTPATTSDPTGALLAEPAANARYTSLYGTANPNAAADPGAVSVMGSGQSHNNMQPYLAMNYVIALQGIFPPRA
jgi:microcystin-dependent protein